MSFCKFKIIQVANFYIFAHWKEDNVDRQLMINKKGCRIMRSPLIHIHATLYIPSGRNHSTVNLAMTKPNSTQQQHKVWIIEESVYWPTRWWKSFTLLFQHLSYLESSALHVLNIWLCILKHKSDKFLSGYFKRATVSKVVWSPVSVSICQQYS